MKIFKDENDLASIAKEMINIMAQREIFPKGEKKPKGYPKVGSDVEKYHFKFVNGFIFFPCSWDKNKALNYTEKLIQQLEDLEKELSPNYMDFKVCCRREPLTIIKAKHENTGIALNPTYFEDFSQYRIVFKWGNEKDLHKFSGARMTWFLTNIDKFSFDITRSHREYHLTQNLSSLFLDFSNTTKLAHKQSIIELTQEHFALHHPDHLGVVVRSNNPLLIQLNNHWLKSCLIGMPLNIKKEISQNVLDGATLEDGAVKFPCGVTLVMDKLICRGCREEVYGETYALVSSPDHLLMEELDDIESISQLIPAYLVCQACIRMRGVSGNLCKNKEIYRIKAPKSGNDVIEELEYASEELKRIYKEIMRGNITFSKMTYKKLSYRVVYIANYIAVPSDFYKKILVDESFATFNKKFICCKFVE